LSYFETGLVERPDLNQVDGLDVAFTSDNFSTYVSSRYGATFRARTGYNTVADRLVSLINEAQESIWVASGHMRSRPIADALKAKQLSNPELDIRVYLDGQEYISGWKQGDQGRDLQECLEAAGGRASKEQKCYDVGYYFGYELGDSGMDVRYKFYAFRWNYAYAVQMHHKYIIVDGTKVASGSYNFSDNAEHNTIENVVFYSASRYPQVVSAFIENFQSIWNTGEGLLDELITVVQTDDTFPIVFDSMALSWTEVTRLKNAIRENCPEIYSDEFRNNATEHLSCTRP
jgi:phosphatidylserine/phosphatidylglycerophosphate/cardiolipin synthase-like enzyme